MTARLALRPILVSLLLLASAPLRAQTLPAPFEAEYEGDKFPLHATARISLARIGDHYRYVLRGSVYAAFYKWTDVYDCSVLQVRDDKLYPLEYVHRDSRNSGRNVQTRFDWAHGSIHTSHGGAVPTELKDVTNVAWDLMSIQVRLRADVPEAKPGAAFDYDVLEKGSIMHYRAHVEGLQAIDTGGGTVEAVKVEARGAKHTNRFWFAPKYAWLPVRLSMGDVTLDLTSAPDQARREAAPASAQAPTCE